MDPHKLIHGDSNRVRELEENREQKQQEPSQVSAGVQTEEPGGLGNSRNIKLDSLDRLTQCQQNS